MKIETRFSLGDRVVVIHQVHETLYDLCPDCGGSGRLALVRGGTTHCVNRECRSGRIARGHIQPWRPYTSGMIGKIDVEAYSSKYEWNHTSKTQYMIDSTGVGSGTLWDEDKLCANDEEAVAECGRRNGTIVALVADTTPLLAGDVE